MNEPTRAGRATATLSLPLAEMLVPSGSPKATIAGRMDEVMLATRSAKAGLLSMNKAAVKRRKPRPTSGAR